MNKQRLIDADALKGSVRKKFKAFPDRCEINELVNAAPVIDAIPVEWLKRLMFSRDDDIDKVEFAWIMRKWEEVKQWAAKHPKQVFPTWMEWLAANVPGVDADSIYEAVRVLNRTHIPADIAEKLEIEPKEG